MKFTIEVDVSRAYGHKELHEYDSEELAELLMDSLVFGFQSSHIEIDDTIIINRESEE